jgi:LuxR family transcriptional regulator, activator of conjugal transfer of Ti plasmids
MRNFEEEFAHKISSISNIDDLRNEFSKYSQNVGMSQFSYHIVRHSFQRNLENYYVTDYPKEWQARYIDKAYYDSDPLLKDYSIFTNAFTWGSRKNVTNAKALQMFYEASDFGLAGGIGIPIPGPLNSFSVVTLCSPIEKQEELQKINKAFSKDLTIAALLFHSATLLFNSEAIMHQQCELTRKETEYLKWLCIGKTNSEIGSILNVSESNVKKRVMNIYSKLGVSTRHEAIIKSLHYKIIEV